MAARSTVQKMESLRGLKVVQSYS